VKGRIWSYRRVEVIWVDVLGSANWEKIDTKLADMTPESQRHRTMGWVLREDDTGIVLAASRNEARQGPWEDMVADVNYIPRQSIIEVRTLVESE
jgi:hypothetical protein